MNDEFVSFKLAIRPGGLLADEGRAVLIRPSAVSAIIAGEDDGRGDKTSITGAGFNLYVRESWQEVRRLVDLGTAAYLKAK